MASSSTRQKSKNPTLWSEYEELDSWKYSRVKWEKLMDYQQFVRECPWEWCSIEWLNGKRVPMRCPNCKTGKMTMRKANLLYERAEEQRLEALRKERERARRAEEENPGLFRTDKLWQPHAPGVALIRGDLLLEIAGFFLDCDIFIEEHNAPETNPAFIMGGRDVLKMCDDPRTARLVRAFETAQIRVAIDKFRTPPEDLTGVEHPGETALCGMRGAHGNAVCGLIVFLGSTGDPAAGKVDTECSYWFYSALGIPGPTIRRIGGTPFRMVRLPKRPFNDMYDLMLRLDLRGGRKRVKSYRDNYNENVKEWKINHVSFEKFRWGNLKMVRAEHFVDDEVSGLTDSSEDSDVTKMSDMSGSTDRFGVPMSRKEQIALEKRFNKLRTAKEGRLAAQAALETRLADEAADRELSQRRTRRFNAALRRRLAAGTAELERRHAVQAARALAEARKKKRAEDRSKGLAVAPGEDEESAIIVDSGEDDVSVIIVDSGEDDVSVIIIDSREEGDAEEEPRDNTRRHEIPEFFRRGGKK